MLLSFIRKFPFLKVLIKFCIVGAIAAVINFSIYYSLTQVVGLWYVYSAVYSFSTSAVFNFTTNKLWTFRNKERGRAILHQISKFLVVMAVGLTLNTSIIYSLTEWGSLNWKLSWVFATGIVTFWNFTFNRFWTFKEKKVVAEAEVVDLNTDSK